MCACNCNSRSGESVMEERGGGLKRNAGGGGALVGVLVSRQLAWCSILLASAAHHLLLLAIWRLMNASGRPWHPRAEAGPAAAGAAATSPAGRLAAHAQRPPAPHMAL